LATDVDPFAHSWTLTGVLCTVLGTSIVSLGFVMQKRAHQVRNGRIDSVPYFLEVPWIVAFLTYISGHLVCWLGLGMAPQAVLVQLNSWTVAATGVLGCIVLGETMTFQRFIFIAWLAIGCGLVVTNGPQTNTSETLASLSQRAANHNVHVCALVMISACFMVLHMRIFFGPARSSVKQSAGTLTLIAAIIAWFSSITSKCTSSLTLTAVRHVDADVFTHWQYWTLHGLMLFLGCLNMHFINLALQKGEVLFVLPLYEALSILGQVILAGIFFDEFESLRRHQLVTFFAIVLFVVGGLIGLSADQQRGEEEEQETMNSNDMQQGKHMMPSLEVAQQLMGTSKETCSNLKLCTGPTHDSTSNT